MLVPYNLASITFYPSVSLSDFVFAQQTVKIGKLARQFIVTLSLALCTFAAQGQTILAANTSLEQQVTQLRQILLEQDLRISQQQEEIQDIRGKNEVLLYNLDQLKQQQQDIYVDLDQRISELKSAQLSTTAVQPPITSMVNTPDTMAASTDNTAPQTPSSPEVSKTIPIESSPQEEETYKSAFKLLQAGRYKEAIEGFKQVLQQFAQSEYADNAQYWIAESQYALRNFDKALQEFNNLLQQYTDSPKRSHALLKMGYIHYELKDYAKAREVLNDVVNSYPGSASARLADQRLQRMQVEGK
jgi:tol-pal system protein YbgF